MKFELVHMILKFLQGAFDSSAVEHKPTNKFQQVRVHKIEHHIVSTPENQDPYFTFTCYTLLSPQAVLKSELIPTKQSRKTPRGDHFSSPPLHNFTVFFFSERSSRNQKQQMKSP